MFKFLDDLVHMRATKVDQHNHFAEINGMSSYYVSAKSGENVNAMFYKIAADLANISVSKTEIEAHTVYIFIIFKLIFRTL